MQTKFNPELQLDRAQQAALAATAATEGYKVIHLIARSEVDKFIVDFINARTEDADTVLERHRVIKTAAQLYEGITQRINHEVQKYILDNKQPGEPVDITEGLLDLGPHTSRDEAEIRPFEEEAIG